MQDCDVSIANVLKMPLTPKLCWLFADSLPESPGDVKVRRRGSRTISETSQEEEEFTARAENLGITVSRDVLSDDEYESAEEECMLDAGEDEAAGDYLHPWSKDSDTDTVQEVRSPNHSNQSWEQDSGPQHTTGSAQGQHQDGTTGSPSSDCDASPFVSLKATIKSLEGANSLPREDSISLVAHSVVLRALKDAYQDLQPPTVEPTVTEHPPKKVQLNAFVPEFVPSGSSSPRTSGLNVNCAEFKPKVNLDRSTSQLNADVPEFQPTWSQSDPQGASFDLSHSSIQDDSYLAAEGQRSSPIYHNLPSEDYDESDLAFDTDSDLNSSEMKMPMLRHNQRTSATQTSEKTVRLGRDVCTATDRIKTHNRKLQVGPTLGSRKTMESQTEIQQDVPRDLYEAALERAMQAEVSNWPIEFIFKCIFLNENFVFCWKKITEICS